MSSMLIECRPLMVLPPLMVLFKGNYTKALIVQQIHFLVQQKRSGIVHEGHKWVWFTYEEWCEDTFTWLSPGTLGNTVRALEADGYIISTTRIKDKWDNTKYYRLNYDMLEDDTNDVIDPNVDVGVEENANVGVETNEDVGFLYTETSSKTSPKSSLVADATPTPQQEMFGAVCEAIGWDYNTLSKDDRGQVAQAVGILRKANYTVDDIRRYMVEIWFEDWRWKKERQHPTLKQLRQEIGKLRSVMKDAMPKQATGMDAYRQMLAEHGVLA